MERLIHSHLEEMETRLPRSGRKIRGFYTQQKNSRRVKFVKTDCLFEQLERMEYALSLDRAYPL